jgi:hypothetical protein
MKNKIKRVMPDSDTLFLIVMVAGVLYIWIDCTVKMSRW